MAPTTSESSQGNYMSVVVPTAGQALECRMYPIPIPARGQVRLKVKYAGVRGTDRYLAERKVSFPIDYVLGHEGVGYIDMLGEGVTTDHAGQAVQGGDMVYWNPVAPCHACYNCTISRDFTACSRSSFLSPADRPPWASYTQVAVLKSDNAFYRVDPQTPPESVIALGCALPTMLQGVDNLGGIDFGSTVVIQGAGVLGLAATMLARLAGALQIVVIELHQKRLDMAKRFGATECISIEEYPSPEKRLQRLRDILAPHTAPDLVIEASGQPQSVTEGLKFLGRNGKYLLVGTWAGTSTVSFDPFEIVRNANRIIGTTYAAPQHYYRAVKLVEMYQSQFPLADCVTHILSLQETEQAFDLIRSGDAVKVAIDASR